MWKISRSPGLRILIIKMADRIDFFLSIYSSYDGIAKKERKYELSQKYQVITSVNVFKKYS